MRFMKWKILVITCIISLLPIFFGLAVWDSLPETMAIHFNINNQPDGWASRAFVVFGLPVMMVALQCVCCIINDINAAKHGERRKLETATKCLIPFMSVVLQIITLGYGLGWKIDIRKIVMIVLGGVFLVLGNYMPKFDYIKNHKVDTEKARRINRFIGYETFIMGILFIVSVFLPPVASVVCVLLLIPYTIISVIYGIKIGRK